jgi:hypothetical protein
MRKNLATYHLITALFFALILVSCREKAKPQIVDLDELRPKPERDYLPDPDTVTVPMFTLEDVNIKFKPLVSEIFLDSLFTPIDTEIYPFRFGAKEYLALEQKDINQNVLGNWCFLDFGDSVLTDNALLNWLDCFGKDCQSLTLNSQEKITENTGQIWTTAKTMVVFLGKNGYNMTPKELLQMDIFLEDKVRFGVKWSKNNPAEWQGSGLRKK